MGDILIKRLFVGALFAAPAALAGVNTWTPAGPDGGSVYGGARYVAPNTAVAVTTGGIYRTTDSGRNWTRRYDFGASSVYVGLATNPAGTQVLAHGDGSSFVLRSVDGGATFTPTPVTSGPLHVSAAAFTRDGTAAWLGLADGRVFRSGDGGATWSERSTGLPSSIAVGKIEVDATDPQRLWLHNGNDIWRTTNDGANWTRINGGNSYWAIFASRTTHDLLLANTAGVPTQLVRSVDGGDTFAPLALSGIETLEFSPSSNTALAIDSEGRARVTTDNGDNWSTLPKLPLKTAMSVAFDPASPGDVLVGTTAGVAFTADTGQTWSVRHDGIHETAFGKLVARRDSVEALYALTFDDQVVWRRGSDDEWTGIGSQAGQVLVGTPSTGGFGLDIARSAPGTLYVVEDGKVGISADDGATWQLRGDVDGARTITVDPQDSSVAYVGGGPPRTGRKSIDSGATWLAFGGGLPSGIEEILVDPTDSQVLYAVRDVTSGAPPAVYKSVNGGTSWSGAATGIGDSFVWNVTMHPAWPQTLYACGIGGVWRTVNGGSTWTRIFDQPAFDIAVSPDAPHALYLSANEGSVRSVDDGASWESLGAAAIGGGNTSHIELVPGRPATALLAKGNRGLSEITVSPDLRVDASVQDLVLDVRQTVRFTVTNDGPFTATNVSLVVGAPASRDAYATSVNGLDCTLAGRTYTCLRSALRPNSSATFDLALTPDADGQALTALVAGFENDPQSNDNAWSLTPDRRNDLRVDLGRSVATAVTGGEFTYLVTLSNLGPSVARDLRGTVTLPANVTYLSVAATDLTCTHSGGVITCLSPQLAVDTSAQATIRVAAGAAGTATATAGVAVGALGVDPVTTNNSASVSVIVSAPPAPPTTPPSSGGKKGGGALDCLLLLVLLAGGAMRSMALRGP